MTSAPLCCSLLLALAGMVGAQAPSAAPTASTSAAKFRISGKVVNSLTGSPVSGATVAIAPTTAQNDWQSVESGADGSFGFQDLAAAKYALLAFERGFGPQLFNEHGGYSTAIATGPDLISEGLIFRLKPEASLHGQIADDANEPVAGATVLLFRRALPFGRDAIVLRDRANSDDRGRFHFAHLPAGNYLIAVEAHPWYAQNQPPHQYDGIGVPQGETQPPETETHTEDKRSPLDVTFPLTFYPGTPDAGQAGVLTISPGERAEADISVRAVPAVRLRVNFGAVNNGGSATLSQSIFGNEEFVPGVQVNGVRPGIFELDSIAPGSYIADLYTPAGHTRAPIDLSQDSELNADEAQPTAAITGAIHFAQPPPPGERFLIQLVSAAGGARFAAVATSPKYDFNFGQRHIPPGAYTVLLGNGAGFLVTTIGASGAQVRGHMVQIGENPVVLSLFASRGIGRIDGLAAQQGKPLAGAMIILVPPDPENNAPLFRFDQSDSDGTFTLAAILPGKYQVVAIADGWGLQWSDPAALSKYLPRGIPVKVAAGGPQKLRVEVQPK